MTRRHTKKAATQDRHGLGSTLVKLAKVGYDFAKKKKATKKKQNFCSRGSIFASSVALLYLRMSSAALMPRLAGLYSRRGRDSIFVPDSSDAADTATATSTGHFWPPFLKAIPFLAVIPNRRHTVATISGPLTGGQFHPALVRWVSQPLSPPSP